MKQEGWDGVGAGELIPPEKTTLKKPSLIRVKNCLFIQLKIARKKDVPFPAFFWLYVTFWRKETVNFQLSSKGNRLFPRITTNILLKIIQNV